MTLDHYLRDDVFIVTQASRRVTMRAPARDRYDRDGWGEAFADAIDGWIDRYCDRVDGWIARYCTWVDRKWTATTEASVAPEPPCPSNVVRLTACDVRPGDRIRVLGEWLLVERVASYCPGVPLQSGVIVHRFSRLDDVYAVPANWPPEMLAATG